MKREKLSQALEDIAPAYIEQAALFSKTKNRAVQYLLRAAAVFVLCIGATFVAERFIGSDKQGVDSVDPIVLVEYSGAYYEIVDDRVLLEKRGVSAEHPAQAAGEHLAYLKREYPDAVSNYIVSDEETDIQLLEYSPAPYRAVLILREGEEYHFVLFCNNLVPPEESMPAIEGFNVYGVYKAADIASITPVSGDNRWKAKGDTVKDKVQIELFFEQITAARPYSFDDYHDIAYADALKAAEESGGGDIGSELYASHADDHCLLMIETDDGLRFVIGYYPTYGWIDISACMSYYEISDEMYAWLRDNIK